MSGRDDLRHVATIAGKEDVMIGEAVAEALDHVGEEGVVTVEESPLPGISVEFVEGMLVENGMVSPYMATDQTRMETVYEDPYIFMTTKPISAVQDLMPLLDQVMKQPRPLVILAEKVDGAALGMLVHNSAHGTLEAVAVRAPGLRAPPHRPPQGPGRLHGRGGHHRGGRPDARERAPRVPRQRAPRDRHRALVHVRRGRGHRRGDRGAARPDPQRGRAAPRTRTTARSRASASPSSPAGSP